MDGGGLFENVTLLIANHSGNGTVWPSHEEVEHFLGDPDVDHAAALVLGAIAIVYGRRLPMLLAGVASISLGLWTALVVHDRQAFNQPLFNDVTLPEGDWVPIVAGLLAGAAAAALCKVAWRAALVLLTAGILMLLAMALCRLANVSPDRIFKVGASLLSAYRVIGAVVLVVGILGSALAVKQFHQKMITFASAHLGTLLLLSGVSHFSARVGADAPFSLLDDLARIISEVRDGRCHLWENDDAAHLQKCDCNQQCQTEICAWIASSVAVLAIRQLRTWLESRRELRKKRAQDEERAPLSKEAETPRASLVVSEPEPRVVGAASPTD